MIELYGDRNYEKQSAPGFLIKLCSGKEINALLYKLLIRFLTFLSYSMQYLISPTSNTPVPSVFVFLYHKHSFSLYIKL